MRAALRLVDSPGVASAPRIRGLDQESRRWLRGLRSEGGERDEAIARLHALLLGAARFEVARRRSSLPHLRGDELPDIAMEAADDALMSVLRRLDDFRGDSRFTTWAYKFALLHAASKLRRRAWQERELPLDHYSLATIRQERHGPDDDAETAEVLRATGDGMAQPTAHQRTVITALAVNGVPIDVLAERLDTNRNALYKTLHDARKKLREHLDECGLTWKGDQ